MKFKVLRRISTDLDPTVAEQIAVHQDGFYGPANDYVDNDYPRDWFVAEELMDKTVGFALATPDGEIVKEFTTLGQAEAARQGARVVFNVDVDIDEELVPSEV